MEVRPVAPDEHDALAELTVAAYAGIDGMIFADGYEEELRDVASRVRTDVVLVAVEDGRLVGGTTYVPDRHSPSAEFDGDDEAGMRMLAVDPAARRRGIGSALTTACVERARADGRRRLVLHTAPWMPDAHRLYQRLGFVRTPELDRLPHPDVPLLAYVMTLTGEA